MIELHQRGAGTIFRVRVYAGARANELRGTHAGALKIAVTAAPEKGKANQAIVALLAKQLGLKKSQLEIIAGHTSPEKQILVRDLPANQLTQRLSSFE